MGATRLRLLGTTLALFGAVAGSLAMAQEPRSLPDGAESSPPIKVDAPLTRTSTRSLGIVERLDAPANALPPSLFKALDVKIPDVPPSAKSVDPSPSGLDPVAARAEAKERLSKLPALDDKAATTATKALVEVLAERIKILDDLDKAVKARSAATKPDPSPETLAAEWKADLEKTRALLDQLTKDPDALLPAAFKSLQPGANEAVHPEMKEAIDAARNELTDWTSKLEQYRAEPARKPGGTVANVRTRRDRSHKELAALKARNVERETALADAKTAEARDLAHEKLVNGQWELHAETERLAGLEAMLTLEERRAELAPLNLQMLEAHNQLSKRSLERMKGLYKALTDRQEKELHQAAVKEQTRADSSGDPLERYHAERTTENLELEIHVVKCESALTTNPSPSYEEQHELAERADVEFTAVKHLLDDGKISHIEALRLNNDFRRLSAERTKIVNGPLAAAVDRLTRAENALSSVEMELIYDARDDRFELDNLLERATPEARKQAIASFEDFERKHLSLLQRRRAALEKLGQRAEQTHQEVLRRLTILDEHFGFIRTHLFWVRDEEPLDAATLLQARRELIQLARAAVRMSAEICDNSAWGKPSVDYLGASLGLLLLPWPLRRAHLALRAAALRTACPDPLFATKRP